VPSERKSCCLNWSETEKNYCQCSACWLKPQFICGFFRVHVINYKETDYCQQPASKAPVIGECVAYMNARSYQEIETGYKNYHRRSGGGVCRRSSAKENGDEYAKGNFPRKYMLQDLEHLSPIATAIGGVKLNIQIMEYLYRVLCEYHDIHLTH